MSKKQRSPLFIAWFITLVWGIINLYSASNVMLLTSDLAPYKLIVPSVIILIAGAIFYHMIRRASYANV